MTEELAPEIVPASEPAVAMADVTDLPTVDDAPGEDVTTVIVDAIEARRAARIVEDE